MLDISFGAAAVDDGHATVLPVLGGGDRGGEMIKAFAPGDSHECAKMLNWPKFVRACVANPQCVEQV